MGDVAGVEPAVLVEDFRLAVEIGARHRRPAHLQAAEGLAVPGQSSPVVVGHLHLDAEGRMALLLLERQPLLAVRAPASSGFSVHIVPSGLISVMPQAWITSTP